MYERILVPIDGSKTSAAGLREAIRLAKLTDGQLRLMHVVDDLPFVLHGDATPGMAGDLLELMVREGKKLLEDARAQVKDQGVAVDTVLCERTQGRICDHVLEQARKWDAELIVLGTHGRRGVRRALLGSDAEQILRTATVPVLLVRGLAAESAA